MTITLTRTGVHPGADYKVVTYKDDEDGSTTQVVVLARLDGGAIVPYTDADPLPISGSISSSLASATTSTGTIAAVTDSSSEALASNSSRKGGWVKNIGNTNVFVGLGYTAATDKPNKLAPGEVLQLATGAVKFTGAVNAICSTGESGSLEVVEL